MENDVRLALDKLITVASSDTGQSRRAANFILAWWNAEENGGFDLADLANVDREISEAMATIFSWLARNPAADYPYEYRTQIEKIIERWRGSVEAA